MKKILVIYYTQTGQLKEITDSVFKYFENNTGLIVDYYRIKPVNDFPFPWPSDDFFDAMPESVNGIPMELNLEDFDSGANYDLVVLAYQVWFLSPSIPVNSFLMSDKAKIFFKDKDVITLLGVRNMWVLAQEKVKKYLKQYGARLAGNICLVDKTNNLVSVLTIIKWLMYGNKGPHNLLPEAGVSQKDIKDAIKYAKPIEKSLLSSDYADLQNELIKLNAVTVSYHIIKIEKNAFRIFKKFASFILKKGKSGDRKRIKRVRFFKYYLIFAIYLLFPIASLVFMIKKAINYRGAKKEIKYYQGV